MDKKVKLIVKSTGVEVELTFAQVQRLIKITDIYTCANDDYQIIGNELIKRPSIKSDKVAKKSKPDSKGKTLPK
jgi:hypothetical protein